MRRLMGACAFLALALTGCPADGLQPQQAVAGAAERTAEAESARVAMAFAYETNGFGMTVSSEGVLDFVNDRAELHMEMPGLPEGIGEEGAITMIVDGPVVYMQLPLPDVPTPWVRIDAAELSGAPAEGFAGPAGGQNPADALDYLRGVADDVTEVGREEVRGVDTTRYEGTVNLDRAIEELPEEQREHARRSVEMLGTDELPVVAWVDDEGLLRRMSYDMDLSQMQMPDPPEGTPGDAPMVQPQGSATITMELHDFGVDVEITPPPAEDTTDFRDLGLPGPGQPAP